MSIDRKKLYRALAKIGYLAGVGFWVFAFALSLANPGSAKSSGLTKEECEEEDTKQTICHCEPSGGCQTLNLPCSSIFPPGGHFDNHGNPLHAGDHFGVCEATNTSIPPTDTPTNTPVPPTDTPTNTPIPPTDTPTGTSMPPTKTQVPPTATTPALKKGCTDPAALNYDPKAKKDDGSCQYPVPVTGQEPLIPVTGIDLRQPLSVSLRGWLSLGALFLGIGLIFQGLSRKEK